MYNPFEFSNYVTLYWKQALIQSGNICRTLISDKLMCLKSRTKFKDKSQPNGLLILILYKLQCYSLCNGLWIYFLIKVSRLALSLPILKTVIILPTVTLFSRIQVIYIK